MSSRKDEDLVHSFSRIEDDFCLSIQSGPSSTRSFAERFISLRNESFVNLANLDPSSLSTKVIHTAVTNISTIASTFLDLESKAQDIGSQLQQDISDIFGSLSLGNMSHTVACSQDESAVDISILPDYMEHYSWLVDHVDNPYPSLPVKRHLARQAGTTVKVISDWFIQARRRIGWTSLSKRHFQGNRQLTIDYARRIFYEHDAYLAYPADLVKDFETVRSRAKRLAVKKTECSELAEILVRAVNAEKFDSDAEPCIKDGLGDSRNTSSYPFSAYTTLQSLSTTSSKRSAVKSDSASSRSNRNDLGRKRSREIESNNETDCDTRGLHLSKRSKICASPVSRSASFATSTSSRASTAELQTPVSQDLELPYITADETVNKWLSAMSDESLKTSQSLSSASQPCRKRSLSEASPCARVKRHCFGSVPEASLQVPLGTHQVPEADDIDKILSQLDFSFPPPASILDDSCLGDMMQFNVIDNTVWQEMDSSNLLPWTLVDGKELVLPSLDSPTGLIAINNLPSSSYTSDYASGELEFNVLGSDLSLTSSGSIAAPVQYATDYADPCSTQTFVSSDSPEQPVIPDVLAEGDQLPFHLTILSKSSTGSNEDIFARETHPSFITPNLHPVEPVNLEKLERINQLLAEAARLHQEVCYQEL